MRAKAMRAGMLALVTMIGSSARAAAPEGRYAVDEQAGTVLDNKTGLTWQREVPNSTYVWGGAKSYCQGLDLGGFSTGWRVPTKLELETLLDVRVEEPGPAIDATAFPATPAEAFWTSTLRAGYATAAWFVDFGYSAGDNYYNGLFHRVRCVR